MATYRLTIEYDGTRYSGWQRQENAVTVQGTLLDAIEKLSPGAALSGAGRTDAGVHALGQVAHLVTRDSRDPVRFIRKLNSLLPRDINVLDMIEVPSRFHARHDATERFYLYQVAARRSAFFKKYVWWVRDRIDSERIGRRLIELPGLHDFAAFADKRRADEESGKVLLTTCSLTREGPLLLFRFGGSHFIWKMVRRLVGVLVAVGTGQLPDLPITELVKNHGRDFAALTAPASGLFLEIVRYQGDPPPPPPRAVTPLRTYGTHEAGDS